MKNCTFFSDKLLFSLFLILLFSGLNGQVLEHRTVILMGSKFDISIVDQDSVSAQKKIDLVAKEVTRIENLISEWRPETQISEVNRNAGIKPVKVDKEVFDLTRKAIYFCKISDGAFDISIVAMDKIWKFDGSMDKMPSEEAIKKSVEKVGYKNIVLDSVNSTIFLRNEGMKIGFGSIGKGYAADKGRELMRNLGVKAGIINASGDLSTWGTQPNGELWKVGIENPFISGEISKVLFLKEASVTTSGDYQKFVEFNGKRFSHIIDPKTGYPVSGLTSVTVVGPSAEMANGFSTSIMVLGQKKGLGLIKKYQNYSALLITDQGKFIKSKNFKTKVK